MKTDVYMMVEHTRRKKEPKTSFSAIIEKAVISTLVLTAIATGTVPSMADSVVYNNYSTTATVSMNYESNIDNLIKEIEFSIEKMTGWLTEGKMSQTAINDLIGQLNTLTDSVKTVADLEKAESILIKVNVFSNKLGRQDLKDAVIKTELNLNIIAATLRKNVANIEVKNTPLYNAGPKITLSDINGHWSADFVNRLVSLGGIGGYPDGTFQPDKTITKAEFLSIVMKSLAVDTSVYDNPIEHWAGSTLMAAYENKIVYSSEISGTKSALDAPINRYEMAMIMVRANENLQNEAEVGTAGINTVMADYSSKVANSEYKDYVEQAYMKGFISGVDNKGTFMGNGNGTRGQAATMVVRLLDKSYRSKVVIKENQLVNGQVLTSSDRAPITFTEGETGRTVVPKAGDTYIRKDGTKVVLTATVINGRIVLGYGQEVNAYEGLAFYGGTSLKDGDLGSRWENSSEFDGQPFYTWTNPDTGNEWGYFKQTWDLVAEQVVDEALAKYPNHSAPIGTVYKNLIKYDGSGWSWIGPVAR